MPTITLTGTHLSARVEISCSQDTVANRSTLRVSKIELLNGWDEIGTAYVTGTISINGAQAAKLSLSSVYGCTVSFKVGQWCSVGFGGASISSVTVSHNSDGTCPSVTVSVALSADSADGSRDYGYISGNANLSLPSIPRVTGISAAGVTLGSAMTVKLSRASSAFRDTISWKCGSSSGVVADKTGNTTLTWTPPVSLASQNTQGTTVDIVLTVTTYSGGTAVGSKSVTARCAIPSSVVPTLSVSVDDKTGCLKKYGGYVRNHSQAVVKTSAAGAYGSTVKSIAVSCGNLTGAGVSAVFSLPDPGTVKIRVTVTDSRGRTASRETSVTVTDYRPPASSVTALYRCGANGTPDPQGGYGKAVFTGSVTSLGGKNSAVYRLKKRIRGTGNWVVSEMPAYAGMFSPKGETIFSAGKDDDFEVCVSVSDDFTEIAGAAVVLPVAFSLLDFHRGEKSVGILQRAANPGAVDIGGDTVHHGNRIRDVGAPKALDDAATLRSVDGLFARNLLDNSDFRNPVNQRGKTSYGATNGYTIDRWYFWSQTKASVLTVNNGCVTLTANGDGFALRQNIPLERFHGDTFTYAYKTTDGKITVGTPEIRDHSDQGFKEFLLQRNVNVALEWIALYEGTYTAETLPPYVPKGYAAELAECERYFQTYKYVTFTGRNNSRIAFPLRTKMRMDNYTVTFRVREVFADTSQNTSDKYTFSLYTTQDALSIINSFYNGFVIVVYYDVELSADL